VVHCFFQQFSELPRNHFFRQLADHSIDLTDAIRGITFTVMGAGFNPQGCIYQSFQELLHVHHAFIEQILGSSGEACQNI
jgi:hypothetical protein